MDITNPDKFQMATTVIKNSRSKKLNYAAGITSNRRLLVIKRGHLYYYSNVPKSFRGDPKALNSFHQLPKCSIDIANIKQIKAYETSSEFFSIQFEAKHMMERDDIRKTLTLEDYNFAPKNTKQIIKWQFTCDNQFIKQKWVNALQTLHTHYNKEKVNIQKYFDNVNKKQDQINIPLRNSSSLPWREDQLRKSTASNEGTKFMKKNDEIGIGLSFLPRQNESNSSVNSHKDRDTQQISEDLFTKAQFQKSNQQNQKFRPMSLPKQEQPIKIQTKPLQEKAQKVQLPQNTKKTKSTPSDVIHQIIKEEPSKQDIQTPIIIPQEIIQKAAIQDKIVIPSQNVVQKTTPQAIKIEQPLQMQPLQLQKSRKQSQKPPSKKETQSKQHIQSQNFQPEINESIFKLLENFESFTERISNQRQFYHLYNEFCSKVKKYLKQLLENKLISTHQDLYVHENFVLKIGLVTTQNLVVASKQLIFYNEDKIKSLKTQFKMYDRLFGEFVKNAKKKHQDRNRIRIRVPLAVLIQYKGVIGLAIQDQETWQALQNQNQIRDDRDYLCSLGFDPNNFYFKKSYSQPYRIVFVKKSQKIEEKHHNVSFQPPIYQTFILKAKQQNASTSLASLEKYSKTLKLISNFEGVCPKQQIINALQLCIFCKKIRKIYRSTHGEVEAQHFFNLIFNRDASILPLLKQSNSDYIPHLSGQLLDFIQYYFGITFQLDEKKLENAYKEKDIILDAHCQPIVRFFNNKNMEVFQALNMIDKYFLDEQAGLLKQTIKIKEVLYQDVQEKQSKQNFLKYLELQKNRAQLSYLQSDYIQSIHQCKEYLSKCQEQIGKFSGSSKYTLLKFPIYILMIKVYAHFSEIQMSKTIKDCYDLLVFNFGQQHSSFINLWVLGSFFYLNNFNNFQMAEKLALSALELTEKLFGINCRQRGQMLLDLSKIYKKNRNEIQKSERLFHQALVILSSNGTDSDYILLKNEQMNRILLKDNIEAIQKLLAELLQFEEKIKNKSNKKNLKDVYKMQFEVASTLGDFQVISNIVEKMWNIGLQFKQLSIANAYKLAVMQIVQDTTTKAYTQFVKFLSIFFDISLMLSAKISQSASNSQEKFTKQSAISLITYKLSQSMSLRLVQVIWQLIQQHDRQQVEALITIIGFQDMTSIHSKYVK